MGQWVAVETAVSCKHLRDPNAALYPFVFMTAAATMFQQVKTLF